MSFPWGLVHTILSGFLDEVLFWQVSECQAQLQVWYIWCLLAACKPAAVLSQVTTVANFDSRSYFLMLLMLTGRVSVRAA